MQTMSKYQFSGISQLILLKQDFIPFNFTGKTEKEKAVIELFIHTFCEHQLADNDYMNIKLHKQLNTSDTSTFYALTIQDVLKHITHIIWTDKAIPDYFISKVKDNTLYHLLNRMEKIEFESKMLYNI